MDSESTTIRVEPVYFKNSDVPVENNRWLTVYEICKACEYVVNPDNKNCFTEAAQKIGDLWRVYLNDGTARVNLLMQGITLRGMHVELKDRNPFVIAGYEDVQTTRLFIRNIPLSFDNSEIEKALRGIGVEMANGLKYSRARDPNGKLTNFKTGDRFVDIIVPEEPLPKRLDIGIFTASLYHREQKQNMMDKECGNCMLKGHLRRECPNETVCYVCRQVGHKRGDPECPSALGRPQDGEDFLSTTSEVQDNNDVDDGSQSESAEETLREDKSVSQMISQVLAKETDTQKPVAPKGDKQSLMTAFVGSNLQPAQMGGRAASPAGRRKLADRSPDVDSAASQKDKKNKKIQK